MFEVKPFFTLLSQLFRPALVVKTILATQMSKLFCHLGDYTILTSYLFAPGLVYACPACSITARETMTLTRSHGPHLIGPWCTVSSGDGGTGTRLERAPASSPAARRKKYASPCDGRLQRAPSVGDDEPGLSATYLQGPVIPLFAHTLVGCQRCIQLCLFCTVHNAHTTL